MWRIRDAREEDKWCEDACLIGGAFGNKRGGNKRGELCPAGVRYEEQTRREQADESSRADHPVPSRLSLPRAGGWCLDKVCFLDKFRFT